MFRLLLASSFAFVGTASAFAQSNPHHTSAELTAAWQEVKSRVFSTTLTWKLESSRGTKDEPFELRDVWEGRYLKFGGNGLLDLRQVRGPDKNNFSLFLIENPSYRAEIERAASGQWRLKGGPGMAEPLPDDQWIEFPWLELVDGIRTPELVAEPTVHWTSIDPPVANSRRHHFENQRTGDPKKSVDMIVSGWLDIEDAKPRRILRSEVVQQTKFSRAVVQGTYTYADTEKAGGFPVIEKVTVEKSFIKSTKYPGINSREVKTYHVDYNQSINEREFYLSHYGLPAPPGITPPVRPTPNYVWLLLAAAVLGVIALACRWLLKRKATVVPPPVPPTPTA